MSSRILLMLDIDDLLPLTEVLDILQFAEEADGDIKLTAEGKAFADAGMLERKKIFAKHLFSYVPIVRYVYSHLNEAHNHRLSRRHVLHELEEHLSDDDAIRILKIVIEWGRYAELFAYNDNSGEFNLENPE